jgi:hypothetical protein
MKKILIAGLLSAVYLLVPFNLSAQFTHHLEGEKLPWTGVPDITGDKFRFVIIGDLTGGEEEGVFASVIEKINSMAPDFVMCVGDLIDGYTIDTTVMKSQWKSFHERIAKLNAPFFYMPGNHDVANRMLFDEWIKLYGYDYYSFYISGTLFLVMNCYESEEGELSDRQVEYIKKTLLAHDPEKPVYIFSHPPLWDLYGKKGLNELEPLFYKYKTTFFFGDDHHYVFKMFNGRPHYMLAESGGDFRRENISLGLFNHFLWLTSASDSLTVANILSRGIIPPDIVSNENEKQVYTLLRSDWLSIRPTYITGKTNGHFSSFLTVKNRGDYPLEINGRFPEKPDISFEPESFSFIVPPGETQNIPVSFKSSKDLSPDELPVIDATVKAKFHQEGRFTENQFRKKWVTDNLRYCTGNGQDATTMECTNPAYIEESWSWSGPADGSFSFTCTHSDGLIRLSITTVDDILVADSSSAGNLQDRLFINFCADTAAADCEVMRFEMTAGSKAHFLNEKQFRRTGITGNCTARGKSLSAELRIPEKNFKGDCFRINIGFRDQDDTTSSDQSVIWWKPALGSQDDYPGAGVFMIK